LNLEPDSTLASIAIASTAAKPILYVIPSSDLFSLHSAHGDDNALHQKTSGIRVGEVNINLRYAVNKTVLGDKQQ